MVDPIPATPGPTTIVNTPPPVVIDPAATLFPASAPPAATPAAPVTPPVVPPPAPVVPPPAAPVTLPVIPPPPETKPPTEPKPADGKPPTPPVPTEYDLKLPDGSLLSPEDLATTLKDAKEAGLTKEQAESLLKSKDQGATALKTRQDTAFAETKRQWKEAVSKDTEMGGDKLAETYALSARAFKELASAEMQVWVEKTGLGDYPEFVRFCARIGKMMGEDKLIRGHVGPEEKPRPPEEVLYGKTTPKN